MDLSEKRDEEGDESSPDAYWRRRVIALALGLGLLGILAWSFSGGGGKAKPNTGSSLVPATALGTAVPGLAGGTPSQSPSVSGPATASPSAARSAAARSAAARSAAARSAAARKKPATARRKARAGGGQATPGSSAAVKLGPDGQCPAGSVVLSLFTDRTSYLPGQDPQFQVDAVSTYPGKCSFNPGQVKVSVLSEGRIIWDSADCGNGRTEHSAELSRGVPARSGFVWNRTLTLPGCEVIASKARNGSYQVQARTSSVASPIRRIKLVS